MVVLEVLVGSHMDRRVELVEEHQDSTLQEEEEDLSGCSQDNLEGNRPYLRYINTTVLQKQRVFNQRSQ